MSILRRMVTGNHFHALACLSMVQVMKVVANSWGRSGTAALPSRLCLRHRHSAAKRAKLHVSSFQCADQQDTRNECEGVFNIYLGPMIVRACTCAILVAAGKLSLCSPHSPLDLLLSSDSGTNLKSNLSLPMVAAYCPSSAN